MITSVPKPKQNLADSPVSRSSVASLTGSRCYADDVTPAGCLYLAFARSAEPCGTLSLDISGAQALEAIVHTAKDLGPLGKLSVNPVIERHIDTPYHILASDHVLAIGQPLAAVLASSPLDAAIAAEAVEATMTLHPHEAQTVASASWNTDATDAFATAAHIIEAEVHHARLAPSPMEPRSITVDYVDGALIIHHSTQTPHRTRSELASILNIDPNRIRVIAQDVGGAFGMKASLYPEEVMAAWAALHHHKPVKWTATRSEDFLSATHGRGITSTGQIAVAADGTILGLRAEISAPVGHWLPNSALIPAWNAARILPGGYDVGAVEIATKAVTAPLAPTGIYRGAGRPEAAMLMERLIDKTARHLGRDPLDLRLQNLRKISTPIQTATGNMLDSGDYAAVLHALRPSYDDALQWRDSKRDAGALAGVGLSFYLEPSGNGWESARVTLNIDGTAHVASGSSDQGQGRATTLAQIAATALDIPLDAVTVTFADTGQNPTGIGALASRSTAIGGSAVLAACQKFKGQPLPATAEVQYENEGQAWGYGAYLVALQVDQDTGVLAFHKVHCVDDAGVVINPALAEGQIRGGFAQGFGEAVMERVVYDENGQLLTGSLMDYALPRAKDVPHLQIETQATASPFNLLGAKGLGEAGTIGAPPAIVSAVEDAIGVHGLQMPLTPFRVWNAMHSTEKT